MIKEAMTHQGMYKTNNNRFQIAHLLPGLFFAMTLFVFAPLELYCSNTNEFWFSYSSILPVLIISSVSVIVVTYLINSLLPHKISIIVQALMLTITILLYIQGNYLTINHGTLNGAEIEWGEYTVRYVLDAIVWITIVCLVLALLIKFEDRVLSALRIVAIVIMLTQVITLAILGFSIAPKNDNNKKGYLSKNGEFNISSKQNTIVFLLDAFDAQLMMNLYEQDPAMIEDAFQNFTFYRDTVGGATRTKYAIPFIFSGQTNTEEISYLDYVRQSAEQSPFFKELHVGEYDTGIYTNSNFVSEEQRSVINNFIAGESKVSSSLGLTRDYMKLVAFRYAPNALERYFWFYSGDFDKWKLSDETGEYATDDVGFYQELTGKGFSVSTNKSCFRFYHLNGAHEPYNMNENCERIDIHDGSEVNQAYGCFRIIKTCIQQLKDLGVYDQSNIIIMADHGYGHYSIVEQNPLFMVKTTYQNGQFTISDTPLSFSTLPEVFAAGIRGELENMEIFAKEGIRLFYLENDAKVIDITEYAIDGKAWDNQAVKATGVVYHGDSLNLSYDYKLGEEISFSWEDTARDFIVSGFSKNEGNYTWTDGNMAMMRFDLTNWKGEDLVVNIILEGNGVYNGYQPMVIYANGEFVEVMNIRGSKDNIHFIISGKCVVDRRLDLIFELPRAISPQKLGESIDGRYLALQFSSMVIEAAKEDVEISPCIINPSIKLQNANVYLVEGFDVQDGKVVWAGMDKGELLLVANNSVSEVGMRLSVSGMKGNKLLNAYVNNKPLKTFAEDEETAIEVLNEYMIGKSTLLCFEPLDLDGDNVQGTSEYSIHVTVEIEPHTVNGVVDPALLSERLDIDFGNLKKKKAFTVSELYTRGKVEDGRIVLADGQIQYGPYIPLNAGTWEVRVDGEGLDNAEYYATANSGVDILPTETVSEASNCIVYRFKLEEEMKDVEFLVCGHGSTPVYVDSVTLSSTDN